jgi:hypothetical protein
MKRKHGQITVGPINTTIMIPLEDQEDNVFTLEDIALHPISANCGGAACFIGGITYARDCFSVKINSDCMAELSWTLVVAENIHDEKSIKNPIK